MTPASTASTTLLKQFGLTTAAEELVPRLTQAGHPGYAACSQPHTQLSVMRLRGGTRIVTPG